MNWVAALLGLTPSVVSAREVAPIIAPAELPAAPATQLFHVEMDPLDFALGAAVEEQAQLVRAGFSEEYAFASAMSRFASEYVAPGGSRTAARKLRSLAGQIMTRRLT